MREYFTVLIKENSTDNFKLLTEKLNAGYHIDSRCEVGRSLMLILVKYNEESNREQPVEGRSVLTSSRQYETARIPF